MADLLENFIEEESTPYVKKLLKECFDNFNSGSIILEKRFDFDRFEITIDFKNQSVVVEDVIDPSPKGQQIVSISEFISRVIRQKG